MKSISERLKEYRLNHNLTQHEMCSVLNVSIVTYNALENGKTNINTETVDKLAKLLNMEVEKIRKCL